MEIEIHTWLGGEGAVNNGHWRENMGGNVSQNKCVKERLGFLKRLKKLQKTEASQRVEPHWVYLCKQA